MSDTFRAFSVIRDKKFRKLTTKITKYTKVTATLLIRIEDKRMYGQRCSNC
jgi:hypothetical protein